MLTTAFGVALLALAKDVQPAYNNVLLLTGLLLVFVGLFILVRSIIGR